MKYDVEFIRPSYTRFFAAHKDELIEAFVRCAGSGNLILRDETRELERKFADYIGTKYAVSLNSGTDALFLSLRALGIGPGDEVITVSHTFIATLQAIVHTGATPILVDVDGRGLMDMDELRKAVTTKTKAIIPVHYHGAMVDMNTLSKIVSYQNTYNGRNLFVVEDAAQALGAWQKNDNADFLGLLGREMERAGGNHISIAGCFSLGVPKLMGAYGDAGMVTVNNEGIYKKLLLLRNHWNITQGGVNPDDYPQPEEMGWGWKSRISNINAAILNVKFCYLDSILKRRNEIAKMYDKEFKNLPLKLPAHQEGEVIQEYVIRVPDNDTFKTFMDAQGIEVLVRDKIPNHKLKGLGLDHFSLPMTERLAKECVRLPIYPEMTNDEVFMVIDAVRRYDQLGGRTGHWDERTQRVV